MGLPARRPCWSSRNRWLVPMACGHCRTAVSFWSRIAPASSIVSVEGDKATIETIKDGFKHHATAVTVAGDTAWVIEAKFAYRNDPGSRTRIQNHSAPPRCSCPSAEAIAGSLPPVRL